MEVVDYKYDLFDDYVSLKIIDDFVWDNIGHRYGVIRTYVIDILKEYEVFYEG